ncbi:alpha/beta fold hydrolase [Agromyces aureus]|nr:alpha/beta hydrolase [Agromyces aureus]
MGSTDASRRALPVARPDGAVIAAEVIGDARHPLVLLVAGAESSMDWWRPEFCDLLVQGGRCVVRFDQRGTGETTLGPPPRTDGLHVALGDAIAVLDAAGAVADAADGVGDGSPPHAAHWVGFSAGGWVAQLAALDHPDRVLALTLIETSPTMFEADPDLPGATDRMQQAWADSVPEPDWGDPESVIEYHVVVDRDYAGDDFDEAHDRAIWADTVRRSPGMHRDEGEAEIVDHGVRWRERLGGLRVPTTVVHGTADPVFPLGNGQALARDIPGARLVTIRGGGHDLPPSTWDAVVGVIAGTA